MEGRYPWLWDVDMDNGTFDAVLSGRGPDAQAFDSRWALVRLIEYAPYADLKRLLPVGSFLALWPELSARVRSRMRREGMDFMYQWLQERARSHA